MLVRDMELAGQCQFFPFLVISGTWSRLTRLCLSFWFNWLKVIRHFGSIQTIFFICHKALHRHHERMLLYLERAASSFGFHCSRLIGNTLSFDWVSIQSLIIMIIRTSDLHRILLGSESILLCRTHLMSLTIIIINSFLLFWWWFINKFDSHFFYCFFELIHIKAIARRCIYNRFISSCHGLSYIQHR